MTKFENEFSSVIFANVIDTVVFCEEIIEGIFLCVHISIYLDTNLNQMSKCWFCEDKQSMSLNKYSGMQTRRIPLLNHFNRCSC